MLLRFSCVCGNSLLSPARHAGKRVRCPICSEPLTVPESPAETPAGDRNVPEAILPSPLKGAVAFSCSCGTTLQARVERAGSAAKCPSCGTRLMIPGSSTTVLAPPAATNPRLSWEMRFDPPPSDRGDADDLDAGDADRRVEEPQRRPRALALVILAGVLCAGVGSYYLYRWWRNTAAGTDQVGAMPPVAFGEQLNSPSENFPQQQPGHGTPPGHVMQPQQGPRGGPGPPFSSIYDPITEANGRKIRQLVAAMLAYRNENGHLPPAAITKGDRPLLSWRVKLLPYLGAENAKLYRDFDLEESWDGPQNRKLLSRMPGVFALQGQHGSSEGKTFFQVFVGPDAPFDWKDLKTPRGARRGRILIAEARKPVPWTKPEDMEFSPQAPAPRPGYDSERFLAAMEDGQVILVPANIPEQSLRAMITGIGPVLRGF